MARWNLPFGFRIRDANTEVKNETFIAPQQRDGAIEKVSSGAGFYGYNFGFDFQPKTEVELINKYRQIQNLPEVDTAVEDIVAEAVVVEQFDEDIVEININAEENEIPENVKEIICDEFKNLLSITEFAHKGHDLFRQWYVDGRLAFHLVANEEDLSEGIIDVRTVDPRKIKKVREITKTRTGQGLDVISNIDEYFVFNDSGISENMGVKLSADTIAYVTSGLTDESGMVISYLHKAIKPANMLRMMEDAMLIYQMTRAPERRVFYVDVSGMPKTKAEQYLKDVMTRYKNKVVYNSCFSMDTKIPLLDGRVLTIAEMQAEHEAGKEMWIYSCDPITGKFAPGLVSSAGVTKFNQKVMRLTLDNGKTITCTLDHKFPVWGKGKTEAKDIVIGDSMMPLYRREKEMAKGKSYEQIWDNDAKKWIYTHRAVSDWKTTIGMTNELVFSEEYKESEKNVVHHMNFKKLDNCPTNLVMMNFDDHLSYHRHLGHINGKATAKFRRENGIPFFLNVDPIKMAKILKENGKKLGDRSLKEGLGIFAMTDEERHEISLYGSAILQEKLKDPEFNKNFGNAIRQGWTEEHRNNAAERAKSRPHSHFVEMNRKANDAKWNGENGESNRKKLAEAKSIEYHPEMVEYFEHLVKMNMKGVEIVDAMNSSVHMTKWIDINSKKNIKKDWTSQSPFTRKNLNQISRKFGFEKFTEYRDSVLYRNHKIVNIEFLEERMDVGTLGIDKDEIYHDHHTFALDAGIYTFNSTGEVRDNRHFMSMLEDFWMPRQSNGRATEITTLPSSVVAGQQDAINTYKDKLAKSLNLPTSRMVGDTPFNLGRSMEITRDEVKFSKFIARLRHKFMDIFTQMLRVQLILKGVISPDDWKFIKSKIQYQFISDNNFAELRDNEILAQRLEMYNNIQPLIGVHFSEDYAKKKILRMTDEEIIEEDKKIEIEREQKIALMKKYPELYGPEQNQGFQQ